MEISDLKTIIFVLAVVSAIAAIVIVIFNRRSAVDKGERRPAEMLEPGWQFYSKPTTLDPPGTVFRIDVAGRRYIVANLEVKATTGREASGKSIKSGQASVGLVASLLGMDKVGIGAKGRKVERLEFEITDPVKEETSDMAIDEVLDPFLERLDYRAENRYFIIREARMASAMKYFLSEQLVNDISGGMPAIESIKTRGEFKQVKKGQYELNQTFDEPMRIMFLPEEIVPISAGLAQATPELGLAPVNETLIWQEG